MGILNITPDSFSDGGKYDSVNTALSHASELIAGGADIIDIGAVSTRPGSSPADEKEELARLEKILPAIRKSFDIPISVDTFRPAVAGLCLEAGADIINDVSGIYSPEMAETVKRYDAGWILMHGGVLISGAGEKREYPAGVINDVQYFFDEVTVSAARDGIDVSRICLDPGFGFGKDTLQNRELLSGLDLLDSNGAALIAALSRKRFIGELSDDKDADRLGGTLAADVIAVMKGADIIRTHETALHSKAMKLTEALK